MKTRILLILIFLGSLYACAPKKQIVIEGVPLKTILTSAEDTLSYSIGISIGYGLQSQNISNLNPTLIAEGMDKVLKKDSVLFDKEFAENYIREFFTKKQNALAEENLAKANQFLQENKKNQGVVELPSGLQYIVLTEGSGPIPTDSSMVKTHYKGTLINGSVFDSSYDRGEPAEFPVNGVIPGWTEALKMMKAGSKWKLFIPPQLAYGEQGAGGVIGPNEVLIFELELLEVLPASEEY